MGLFGGKGGSKSSTEVKADPRVTKQLKSITEEIKNMPVAQYIEHKYSQLTDDERSALGQVAQSGNLRLAAAALDGSFAKGMDQITQNNDYLKSQLTAPVTASQVLSDRNLAIQDAGNKRALSTATGAANKGVLAGSAGARKAARMNTGLLTAQNVFTRGAQGANESIARRLTNQSNRTSDLNAMANIAGINRQAGLTGLGIQQQATQNQLAAGNVLQQEQQNVYNNAYQNANAKALFPIQQLQNKMNLATQISQMAGYKTTGSQASGVSTGQRLLGAGLAATSLLGQAGAFSGGGNSTATDNAWNSYNSSGGQSGVAGPMMGGGNLSTQAQQTQPTAMQAFWNRANQRMGYGNYF